MSTGGNDEFDAELLAMAGGDSSEDEGEIDQTQHFDGRSPSPGEVQQSVEKVDDTGARRGVAQKVRAKRGRRARRREDSEEDGEAFAVSGESVVSEDMARSESVDAPGSPASVADSDAPLYPIEGKFMSNDDRAWLLSLPELEREQELDKRAQEVIRRQQDLQLKRALASARAKPSSKRKASDEFEDTPRKSTRPKIERAAKSALDKYRKAREQAGAEKERRDGRRPPRRNARSYSEESDRDADGESEVEWADPSDSRRDEPMADLVEYNHCRVGRSNFAQVCFYPGFEDAITGCYARVSVGPDRDTGENIYRMALIKGFREGKPYSLEGPNKKKVLTDQYAVVAQGRSEKLWPFAACSDSRFTHEELARYINMLRDQILRVPTRKQIENKVDDIHKLINRRWTDEDISFKIRRQKDIEKKYDPANAGNLAREKILKRKQIAEDEGDDEEIARCNAELQALEANTSNGSAIRRAAPPTPVKPMATTEQERLAQRNALTRKTNTEEVRKALLEERRKEIKAREKAIADAKAKALAEQEAKNKLQVPGNDMNELFGDGSDISRSGTPLNGTKSVNKSKTSRGGTPLSQNGVKRPLGALRSNQRSDDDIIGAMDLDIDVEI